MSSRPLQAFISSTYEDLKDHRAHVIRALRKAGIFVDAMEDWTASTDEPKAFSQRRVEGCDLCVLLLARRRGHVPDGETQSITQLEYSAAKDEMDTLVFLLKDGSLWHTRFDEFDADPQLKTWRAELKKRSGVGFFDHDPSSIEIEPALARWLQERTAKARTPTPPGTPTISEAYREWVKRETAGIDLLGLKPRKGVSVVLESVYVPLLTKSVDVQRRARRGQDGETRLGGESDEPLLSRLDQESLYVSGGPGSGKSTVCRRVAWVVANGGLPVTEGDTPDLAEQFPETLREYLPVLVPLREFWQHFPERPGGELSAAEFGEALGRWATWKNAADLTATDLQRHLEVGQVLLLLDGVDELPQVAGDDEKHPWSPRAQFLSGLAAARPGWEQLHHRLLVTSRPYGLDAADVRRVGLPECPNEELPPELQQLLVERWFRLLADSAEQAAVAVRDVHAELDAQPLLSDLSGNPLLLTAICIVYHEGGRFPQDTHDLYDRIVDTVLHGRYRQTKLKERARARLCVIAHGMHTGADLDEDRRAPQAEATFTEIDTLLKAFQGRSGYTEETVFRAAETRDDLVSRSGLFVPRGAKRAGFYHLSFQEFLAAERLHDVTDELVDLFRARAEVAEWRNTLSLLFGRVLGAASTTEKARRLGERLVDAIEPEQVGLQIVTGDCLSVLGTKGVRIAEVQESRYQEVAVPIMRGRAGARERCAVGAALGRVGDPRFRQDLWSLPDDSLLGFIKIPGGPFTMGSDPAKDEQAFEDEQPSHRVGLPGYYIARFPVTVAQFRAFVEDSDGVVSHDRTWVRSVANQPVVDVSWHDALAYCEWLTSKLRHEPAVPEELASLLRGGPAWRVTLPSEAEWEKAARGDEGRRFPWGDDLNPSHANYDETGVGGPSAVGCFPLGSTPDGVEELSGNVWEWTRSLWGRDPSAPEFTYPYQADDGREDLASGNDVLRVVRGGSFYGNQRSVRAAGRYWFNPDDRGFDIGFRVVVSPFSSDSGR